MEGEIYSYCTYARRPGILGWLVGWYLVGMNAVPEFGGYAGDFYNMGFHLMLIEAEAPLPYKFVFVPKKQKL
jgi:hypothetical protein